MRLTRDSTAYLLRWKSRPRHCRSLVSFSGEGSLGNELQIEVRAIVAMHLLNINWGFATMMERLPRVEEG